MMTLGSLHGVMVEHLPGRCGFESRSRHNISHFYHTNDYYLVLHYKLYFLIVCCLVGDGVFLKCVSY